VIRVCVRCLLIVSVFLSSPPHAAVVFDNFGPEDSYDIFRYAFGKSSLGPPGLNNGLYAGGAFTPTASFTLDTLELPISQSQCPQGLSCPDIVDVLFTGSSAAGNPDAVIESFHLENVLPVQGPPFVSQGSLITVSSTLHPLLLSGERYWVIVAARDVFGGWHLNSVGDIGPLVLDVVPLEQATVRNQTRPAFRVIGSPVPEPSTMTLVGIGIDSDHGAFVEAVSRCRMVPIVPTGSPIGAEEGGTCPRNQKKAPHQTSRTHLRNDIQSGRSPGQKIASGGCGS
jgi:hypothetical protein